MAIKDVCEEIEISTSTVLGYVCDYLKQNNIIKFNIDTKKFYTEDEKEIILDAIDKFGDDKISSIKKALPDYIKYESIRAIILERYL
ncbi:hypothetical protein SDC9_209590 [bioreactor metagenome]|uniref:Helicase Helix-turn-helix domain-containing protein n=2 Tax=root TaxID=1 RepID=A0A645JEE8_9ZZZZ